MGGDTGLNDSGAAAWIFLALVVTLVAVACGAREDPGISPVAAGSTPTIEPSAVPATTTAPTTASIASTTTSGAGNGSLPPTSAPSAERRADGTVVSAGGYRAKTPAVARGLLLEPTWTDEQQEAADVIHRYLDAMVITITDRRPDTTIPTSMTDLERPDLNPAGLRQLQTQNVVRGNTRIGQYWVEPPESESAFWVFGLTELKKGRLQVALCEYNDFRYQSLKTDEILDSGTSSSFWDGQMAPTEPGWRVVAFVKTHAKNGRTGCASNEPSLQLPE